MDIPQKKKRYTIYVGLNDKDAHVQKHQEERIMKLAAGCCKGYALPFSCYFQNGGYADEHGNYILEKSIAIVLIDPCEKLIEELGGDLCAFLNQEKVLVTVDEIECRYISCSLPK